MQRTFNPAKATTRFTTGQIVSGTVTGTDYYGIFVSFRNGESGLVPPTEICWPGQRDRYIIGANVKVLIRKFTPGIGLSLSIKRATQDREFNTFLAKHSVGDTVPSKITDVVDYGVFASVAPGVFGLMHCSVIPDLSAFDKRSIGTELPAVILSVSIDARRLSLAPANQDIT